MSPIVTAPKIYLVHAVSVSVAPCNLSFARLWPLARTTHLLDESLATDLVEQGGDSTVMIDRFQALGRYCEAAGAHAILFTCSAFGAAIDAVKKQHGFPVLAPYEALFDELSARGGRAALLTTFPPSLPTMTAELRDLAARNKSTLSVESQLVEGALDALLEGDHATHDRLIAQHVATLRGYDSIALGQVSMASAVDAAQAAALAPVLTTPQSAGDGSEGGVLLTNIGTPWTAHKVLAAKRADVITCTIQGNGDGTTAVDYTVHCATGYPAVTGGGSLERPVNQVMPAWDIATAYQAALAITAAVTHRRQTGEGKEMMLALSDMAFAMLSHLGVLGEAEVLRQERPSLGNHLYGAFGRDFGTADGRRMMVVAISTGQWRALQKACGVADAIAQLQTQTGLDFADEGQRYEAREAIAALLEPWFATRTHAEVVSALDANRVCWGPYQTAREALTNDPRASLANSIFERIDTPGFGPHISAGTAVRVPDATRAATRPAQLLGADTDAVLHDVLGLATAAIGKLYDAGIVAGPERDPTTARA